MLFRSSNNRHLPTTGNLCWLVAENNATVTVSNCTFSGNLGNEKGTYLYCLLNLRAGKAINIKGCNFFDNRGCPIWSEKSPTDGAMVEDCEIYNNTNPCANGSIGVYTGVTTTTVIRDCNIHDNTGRYSSVFMSGSASNMSIIRTKITNNTATYANGGICVVNSTATCNIVDSIRSEEHTSELQSQR